MSTKTSIKRIALVAVSALGFGLLSVVPVNAAVTAISIASPSLNRASSTKTVALTVTNTGVIAAAANQAYTAVVLSVPATATSSTMEVGDKFQVDLAAGIADDTDTTLTLGAANAGSNLAAVASVDARLANDGVANLNTGDVIVGGYDQNGNGDYSDAADVAATGVSNDYFNVAGTYTFGVYFDANGNGVIDAADLATYTTTSVTVGGAPVSMTLTPASTTVGSGITSYIKVYVYDSGSRLTALSGTEGIRLTATSLTGTATNLLTVEGAPAGDNIDDAEAADSGTAVTAERTYIKASFSSDAGGTIKVTGQFFGGPAPLATAATSGTIQINAAANATKLAIATAGLTTNEQRFSAPAAVTAAADSDTVYANAATTRAVSFTVTGTPSTYVNVTLSAVTDASLSLVAGTRSILIGSTGTATYTVSPDYVTAASTYTVTVPRTGGTLSYTVNYDAPTVACVDALHCSISTSGIPLGVAKDVRTAGATNSYTVVVKDQFGTAYPNYKVTLTSGTTARNASLDVSAFTDTNGSATVSYTDASTSTTVLTDAIKLSVYAPSDLTTNLFTAGNTMTLDYSGTLGSLTLTGGTTAAAVVKRMVVNSDVLNDDAAAAATRNVQSIGNTLLSSTQGAVTGYKTTYTGSAGLLFIVDTDADDDVTDEGDYTDALPSVTVTNGTPVFVLSTKPGVGTITVNAGGLTKTATVTFTVDPTSGRNLTIAAGSTSSAAGKWVNVTATVTDGFGNPVPYAQLSFSRSGGRFSIGTSQLWLSADENGVGSVDVTADTASSVAVTATLGDGLAWGNAQAGALADDPVTGFAAAASTKSLSVSFTGTASDDITNASAAAEAAADAALEAIDAANAATDAANLAAEAADAATVAAEEARDAADAATAAVEALATQVATLISALKAQITTLANTVAKIAKKVKA